MKNKVLAILMTALLLGSTLIGCNQKYDEVATKQEHTMKKQNKAESNTKKENKDSLVPAAKKDSKAEKEDSTKKEKNNPKESVDKKDKVEQKQVKENKPETAKSESKPKGTSKPSSKPTENKKPSNNSTSKPTPKPETKPTPENKPQPKPETKPTPENKPQPMPENKPAEKPHEHTWVPNVIEEAWVEENWKVCSICSACGVNYDLEGYSLDQIYEHEKAHALNGENSGHYSDQVLVGTIPHDAVIDGYICSSCGAKKQ